MKFAKEQLKLYAITDRSWLAGKTLMEQVEQALKGGATMIQLRENIWMKQLFTRGRSHAETLPSLSGSADYQ